MNTVSIREVKTNLSRLLGRVMKGESFVIAKAGKPLAKVVPLDTPDPGKGKRLGFMAGQLSIPDDFDRMGEKEIDTLLSGRD